MKLRFQRIFIIAFIFTVLFQNSYSQWTQIPSGTSADLYDVQFINAQTGYIVGDMGKVIKTTNEGLTWSTINLVNYYTNKYVSFINSSTGFISTSKEYVEPYTHYLYRTTNAGDNWSMVYDAGEHYISKINFMELAVGYFSITRCDTMKISKIFRGPAQGPWTLIFSTTDCGINAVKFTGSTGYAAGFTEGKVFKSTDYGNSWQQQFLGYIDPVYEMHLFNKDTVILSGSNGKIFRTINGGVNWVPINSGTSLNLGKMSFPDPMTGYIATANFNYLKTTDGGNLWRVYNTGVQQNLIGIYFLNANTGYAVGTQGLILKTTNGGAIGLQNISSSVPEKFELMQNYPNPFNPSTKIKFDIPLLRGVNALSGQGVLVRIVVYDLLGREVENLVNETLKPGIYEVDWNAMDLPSGVYYYTLKSDGFVETKKMILIK